LVSYADFITLLFAFFTVMYATSQADVAKQKEFEKSIRQSFAGLGGQGAGSMRAGESVAQGGGSGLQMEQHLAGRPVLLPGRSMTPAQLEEELSNDLSAAERPDQLIRQVRQDRLGVRIELDANRLFAEGTARLRRSALAELDRIASRVRETDLAVEVEAHAMTASDPVHSEWDQSATQGSALVVYLIGKHGFLADAISVRAFGDSRPLVESGDEAQMQRNNRIELLIKMD
jgi:chemotaxis protein MotB